MKSKLICVITAGAACLLVDRPYAVAARHPSTRPAEMLWGKSVDGIRGSIALFGHDGDTYHPGEPISCSAVVQNISDNAVTVPRNAISNHVAQLHVRLPDGHEVVTHAENSGQRLDDLRSRRLVEDLGPEKMANFVYLQLRMGDQLDEWYDPDTSELLHDVSFRSAGNYEFWFDYVLLTEDTTFVPRMLVSNHAVVTVSELPAEKRQNEPTPKQLALLQKFLDSKHEEGLGELFEAMGIAENEGLALRIVDVARKSPDNPRAVLVMLIQERYGLANHRNGINKPGAGIDGPYLERFADFCLDRAEGKGTPRPPFGGEWDDGPDWSAVAAYLRFHPEKSKVRDRAVDLAKASLTTRGRHRIGISTAVGILLYSNELHAGMTVDGATDLLGRPSMIDRNAVEWLLYQDDRGVWTRLVAKVKDEKVTEFREQK